MFLKFVRLNADVVEVGDAKQVKVFLKTVFDEMLELGGGIGYAEGHNCVL